MIILSQEGNRIVDWSRVQKVYQLGSSAMIRYIGGEKDYDSFGKYRSDNQANTAKYRSDNQANTAIGRLFYALAEGETSFQFPQPNELPESKAHYGAGGGKRHGHGGS